jgi:hypothetical protein
MRDGDRNVRFGRVDYGFWLGTVTVAEDNESVRDLPPQAPG